MKTEKPITVEHILQYFESWAATQSAEDWDHVGLQAGSLRVAVKQIMTTLDITPAVVEQAAALGADLLVSHHPVIFHPLTQLPDSHPVYRLARHGIAALAMHTNMDKAVGGVNDALAAQLGLSQVRVAEDGYCRVGSLLQPLPPQEFAAWTAQRLHIPNGGIQWMNGGHDVQTVAVCGGAGGDFLAGMMSQADAFVTGELRHHEWPSTSDMTVLAAGHYYTECGIKYWMARRLQEKFPSLTVTVADESSPFEPWYQQD